VIADTYPRLRALPSLVHDPAADVVRLAKLRELLAGDRVEIDTADPADVAAFAAASRLQRGVATAEDLAAYRAATRR
jgi:hypothetical protein